MTQIVPIIITAEASQPTEYCGYFKTPEGYQLYLHIPTSNKALADQYCLDIAQKMGWQILEAPDVVHPATSLWSKIGQAFLASIIFPILAGSGFFMLLVLCNMAGFIEFRTIDDIMQPVLRWGLLGTPILIVAAIALVILMHSPDKNNTPS